MELKEVIDKFPSIKETQVLSSEMMSEIESGDSCEKNCQPGCKKGCTPGGQNSNNGNGNRGSISTNPSDFNKKK